MTVVRSRTKDAIRDKRTVSARLDAGFRNAVLVDDEDTGKGGVGNEEALREVESVSVSR